MISMSLYIQQTEQELLNRLDTLEQLRVGDSADGWLGCTEAKIF